MNREKNEYLKENEGKHVQRRYKKHQRKKDKGHYKTNARFIKQIHEGMWRLRVHHVLTKKKMSLQTPRSKNKSQRIYVIGKKNKYPKKKECKPVRKRYKKHHVI